jgi:hypothetical protein
MAPGGATKVNIWRTAGPWFFMGGLGLRWATSAHFALTAAVRLNVAFSGGIAVPTLGPEFGAQYGF